MATCIKQMAVNQLLDHVSEVVLKLFDVRSRCCTHFLSFLLSRFLNFYLILFREAEVRSFCVQYKILIQTSILIGVSDVEYTGFSLQYELKTGRAKHRGKTSFVEHRTFLHLYHSFHRLWIFLAMMFQVCNPVSGFHLFVMLFLDNPQKILIVNAYPWWPAAFWDCVVLLQLRYLLMIFGLTCSLTFFGSLIISYQARIHLLLL